MWALDVGVSSSVCGACSFSPDTQSADATQTFGVTTPNQVLLCSPFLATAPITTLTYLEYTIPLANLTGRAPLFWPNMPLKPTFTSAFFTIWTTMKADCL